MTKEEFEAFLALLDPDRELAGEKYEQVRRKLHGFFRGRGLSNAEEAVDEVFNRSARRSLEGGIENIMAFVLGVARRVASEFHRRPKETPLTESGGPPVDPIDYEDKEMAEIRQHCLHRCLGRLDVEQRELVVAWYRYDKGEKVENRKRLAAQLNTTVETLKVRAFRVREKLRQLVKECMKQAFAAAT
jgi:DNA-directed RNA polymerase specialized sigma24 family protein